jgi:hypothetical protein
MGRTTARAIAVQSSTDRTRQSNGILTARNGIVLARLGHIDRRSQAQARRHVESGQKMFVFAIPACGSERFRKSLDTAIPRIAK